MVKDLNQFLHELRFEDLSPEVIEFAKRCVLDLLGVAASAIDTPVSNTIRDHAVNHFGAGSVSGAARLLFDGRSVSAAGAALAGGMTIDAIDAHDGHRLTKGHAGCGVLPAVLALLDSTRNEEGRELLTSVVIGYEVATRAGIALHRTVPDYHSSGSWVSVACAALTARYLDLDTETTRHAIGIAEYHGPRSQMMRCVDHPTMVKDGSGWGAMAGVSAGFLAADGFTGAPAITVESDDVADLWDDLGSRWYIFEQYFKPHPVCRWGQPSVEAALSLQTEHGFSADEVDHIDVHTFHEGVRLAVRRPLTTEEAQYSLPFPTAAALVHGDVGPAQVSPGSLADPEILRLSDSVVLIEDEAYNKAFPDRRLAHVEVHLRNGTVLTSDPTEARGDPDAHLSQNEIEAKFIRYAEPILGPDRTRTVSAGVGTLTDPGSLPPFLDTILT